MECSYNIDVVEPREGDMMFHPYVMFQLEQLNPTPQCMNDRQIDEQVTQLIEHAKIAGKQAKKKLKDAMARHDALLEKNRQG